MNYVNVKEGGVGGVKLAWEECETEYQAARGVECHERLKTKSPTKGTMIHPVSTPITYALLDKTSAGKVPPVQTGYGRTDTIDSRYFPWAFPLITTYPMQATAIVKYINQKEKGDLRGKKIAYLYLASAYGKEPITYLQAEAKVNGFDPTTVPVTPPGTEQGAQWQQIRQSQADYVIFWGFGVMNQAAIKAEQKIGYPRNRALVRPLLEQSAIDSARARASRRGIARRKDEGCNAARWFDHDRFGSSSSRKRGPSDVALLPRRGWVPAFAGTTEFEGQRVDRLTPNDLVKRGVVQVMEGASLLRARDDREEPVDRCVHAADRPRRARRRARARLRILPAAEDPSREPGGLHVGGRTADDGDRTRADGRAVDDPARRAVDGPGATDRRRDLHHRPRPDPEGRRVVPARRAEHDHREFYLGVSGGDRKNFRDTKFYRRRKRWLS